MKKLQKIDALANAADNLPLDNGDPRPGIIHLANDSRFTESYFNQPLTAYAIGWRDPNNVEATLNFFAPPVRVSRYFTYAEAVNAEAFLSETDDERAIGAAFKQVDYKSTKTTAKTVNRGLTLRVDLDEVADKSGWQEQAVARLLQRIQRSALRRAVVALAAAANNSAKTWDTTALKDPDQDVMNDLVAAATANGVRPNRIGYGDTAWSKRILAHRAQNTAGGFASSGLSYEQLAAFFGVDRVMVSRERYQSAAATKTEVVANLVLMFIANDGLSVDDPSNIKRFVTPAEGGGLVRVYQQQVNAKLFDITVEHYDLVKITSTLGIRKFTVS
jgi:hypothetical protein